MKNPRVKLPIATLAERQRAISRRPLTDEQINKLNRIFELIDQEQDAEEDKRRKKTARSPEAEV
ncbi:hypothetical protein WDW86_03145 [Bdellovibrionota bacterium FG-2]